MAFPEYMSEKDEKHFIFLCMRKYAFWCDPRITSAGQRESDAVTRDLLAIMGDDLSEKVFIEYVELYARRGRSLAER